MAVKIKQFKDIADVANTPLIIEIGGESFELSAIGLWEQAEAKRHMLGQSLMTYDEYVASLPLEKRPSVSEQRAQRSAITHELISDGALVDWWNTLEGMHYWIWQSLKIKSPKITLAEVAAWITDPATLTELADMVATLSGFVEVSDKDGTKGEGSDPTQMTSSPSGNQTSPA